MFIRLADDEAKALLASCRTARLGCIVDGEPYVVPINYYAEEGTVYSHSLPGLKITALRQNPSACLQVDDIENDFRWRSVIAFGKFEEVTNCSERERIMKQLLLNFPRLTPVESVMAEDASPPPIVVYRIRIDRLTGVAED